jgi:hypothetical protein
MLLHVSIIHIHCTSCEFEIGGFVPTGNIAQRHQRYVMVNLYFASPPPSIFAGPTINVYTSPPWQIAYTSFLYILSCQGLDPALRQH